MPYRPIPTSTVYSAKFFRRPEIQEAFEKIDALPDEFWRNAARYALIALVTTMSEISQEIDDLSGEIHQLGRAVNEMHESMGGVHEKLDLLLKEA